MEPSTKMAYKGLTKSYEVTPGPRTVETKQEHVPVATKFTSGGSETCEVKGTLVVPYSPEKCFEMLKDYRQYLLVTLKDNEREATKALGQQFHAKPLYIGDSKCVNCRVEYSYFLDGVVYKKVDEVVDLGEGREKDVNGEKYYRFKAVTQKVNTKPSFPLWNFATMLVFTRFKNDPNMCHISCFKTWSSAYIGPFCVNDKYKTYFDDAIQKELFSFRVLLQATYSPKLPKRDSKVLVIGAGPSGLHMSYELIQRGLNERNITILEKDDRYGGKTLSEKSTECQISDPVFNPPLPKTTTYPIIRKIAKAFYDGKFGFEQFVHKIVAKEQTEDDFERIKRNNLPGALKKQADHEYFNGGECVMHELGTCYLSPSYYAVRTLLKDIQAKVEHRASFEGNEQGKFTKLASADITREVYPDTYSIESKTFKRALTLPDWIVDSGKKFSTLARLFSFDPLVEAAAVNGSVLKAKLKYCKLHENLLGCFHYSLPPQPSEENFKVLVKPLGVFLKDNGLEQLIPLFTYALTAQGYGVIEETPTFLAMQWLTPDLLDGYFEWYSYFRLRYKAANGDIVKAIPEELKRFDNERKGMLVCGWGGLWDRIVALYDLEDRITYKTDIKSITRENGKVQVSYSVDKSQDIINEEYDFLIVGAPLCDPAVDPTHLTLPLDVTPTERDLFLSTDIEACIFKTNLFRPERNGNFEKDHLRIFIDAILDSENNNPNNADTGNNRTVESEVGMGKVFGVRDSYKAVQPKLSTITGDMFDPSKGMDKKPREKMCYQYISPSNLDSIPIEIRDRQLEDELISFFRAHPDYLEDNRSNVEVRIKQMIKKQKAWTYYTHYKEDGLLSYKLWRILDIQGENNTLFVHASTNFESVLDIVNYNYMLLDGLSGRLDGYLPPDNDTRPTPQERPQKVLFNRLKVHKVIRFFLNLIITFIWTVWYIISYPIAEACYLKKQRHDLHVAFRTPNLGSWKTFDMVKFIGVSPSVRGYEDYINDIPSGIPEDIPEDWDPLDKKYKYGDHLFRIVNAPKHGFERHHPNIPSYKEIETSFQWNLTDGRHAIAFWLTTFKDGFNPLLTPTLQTIINSFSAYMPNYYSWIFSWIFASQFRFIIGYSYRIEDEFGGGLRVPDCKMLRVAKETFGTEVGQRACWVACKVVSEEIMRSKKMRIDFQPDYITGCGNGCTIRLDTNVNQTFSDHTTWNFRTKKEKDDFKNIDLSW